MITLYTFGPYFGLPDGSPFVTKAMTLLRMAGLPFDEDRNGYAKAPKGKLPYIDDDGTIVADSTFIRFHLEKKHGVAFDVGLSPEQRAAAWAVERMCEDHLYWVLLSIRWADRANFAKGPAHFFDGIPMPVRPLIASVIRRKTLGALKAHGLGRHSPAEVEQLARIDLDSLSAMLGSRSYLMGEAPCAADATMFAFLAGVLAPVFDTPVRHHAESLSNLVAYRDRLKVRYFPADSA